jgi:hypothetical protein
MSDMRLGLWGRNKKCLAQDEGGILDKTKLILHEFKKKANKKPFQFMAVAKSDFVILSKATLAPHAT